MRRWLDRHVNSDLAGKHCQFIFSLLDKASRKKLLFQSGHTDQQNEVSLFYDGDPYHTETSPMNCSANQWTGFYLIGTSVMKELTYLSGVNPVSGNQKTS